MAEMASRFTAPREVLLDDRGTALRLSWHPEEGVTVASLWRDDRCVGTFRATPANMAASSYLSSTLASAAADQSPINRLA